MLTGIDTGGTFTDLVLIEADGTVRMRKVPSTPADPSQAVLAGLRLLAPPAGAPIVHGTTVATNALLERRVAVAALLTSPGCRDVLEIARQTRDRLYDLSPPPRVPLIPRALRFEAAGRLDWRGCQVESLDEAAVEAALDEMRARGAESVAVCLLFSYLDPEHERTAGRLARARGFRVSLSSEIAPEEREYERTSTTCANAAVAPIMGRYLERLAGMLDGRGLGESDGPRLSVMQSDGGTLSASEAAGQAIRTVLSGPAGGVVAAAHTARSAGIRRIITFDMGGTSTDVALLDGEPQAVRSGEVAGLPLAIPMLDIHTVGAGGGSIARIDPGGALRVGPESAGADPGPVAYGRGENLTVTDAHVLLGRIPAGLRLAGTVLLDRARVKERFASLAQLLGGTAERAAAGILEIVEASMARALRHISLERGHEPSQYALVAYGGAGGLHACSLAEAMGIGRVLLPRFPGAFSALGLALAPVRREHVRSLFAPALPEHDSAVERALEELAQRARRELQAEGVPARAVRIRRFVEARAQGQSHALRVPWAGALDRAARAFHRAHKARYGHADPGQPVEVVAVGVASEGSRHRVPALRPPAPKAGGRAVQAPTWVDGRWVRVPCLERACLAPGAAVEGPAIITQEDATAFLPEAWRGSVLPSGDLLLTR